MTLIPPGTYKARAVRVKDAGDVEVWVRFGRARTGSQLAIMLFEILDGEHQGTRLPWFGFFTDNTWERSLESLRYCGFQGEDLSSLRDPTLAPALDHIVSVNVEHNTNKRSGRVYARVAFVRQRIP